MWNNSTVGVVIPAAGQGTRMGTARAKQFLELDGKPILVRTIECFQSCNTVDNIVLAVEPGVRSLVQELVQANSLTKVIDVVAGGVQRQDSVWNGLQRLSSERIEIVLVHDGVRPFVYHRLIESVCSAVKEFGAAVPAVRPSETLKMVDKSGVVVMTPNRDEMRAVQTPQGFRFSALMQAYDQAMKKKFYATDDAGLVEHLGGKVKTVEGESLNVKITDPLDLQLAGVIVRGFSP